METDEGGDVISFPPSPKKIKIDSDLAEDCQDVPLRCSTPQPAEGFFDDENLDATLEILGISHDSIDAFIDETSHQEPWTKEQVSIDNEYPDSFFKGEVLQQRRGSEIGMVPEILEEILSHLPISHLYCNCRLVCRQWNDIIQREKFLYWKKIYYKYKSGRCSQSIRKVNYFAKRVWPTLEYDGTSLEQMALPLVRFVCKEFDNLKMNERSEKALMSHPQTQCVVRIRELFPSLEDNRKDSIAIKNAVLLVLCSHSVHDVLTVLTSLVTTSSCKVTDIMEMFYCIATLLLVGSHEKKKWPMRVHYNVFYALNVTERGSYGDVVKQATVGQQSIHRYSDVSMTGEQAQIINYKIQPREVIKVMAFAGTGKTTTLLKFTSLNPHMKFLYCVYNKSVQEHASTIFSPNVKCRTFHSLAHGSFGDPVAVGWKYASKKGSVSSYNVSQSIKKSPRGYPSFNFSRHVFQTLEKFIASGDANFIDEHIPTTIKRRVRKNEWYDQEQSMEEERTLNNPEYRVHVLREVQRFWEQMIDRANYNVRMTDDGYLKLYQLTCPEITGYDCILVDEAQDLTPAIISLISCQSCAKIFVGDTHQQIYGFRGATNALEQIEASRVFHLTESFRFGPEIAYVAACTLSVLKDIWRQTLVGSTKTGIIDGTHKGQVAIIARMNVTLFEEMVRMVRSNNNVKLGFAGGIGKYEFESYLDIHKLLCGNNKEIKSRLIKKWKTFDELSKFAERTDDVSLINKLKICQKYKKDLPSLIEKIKSMYTPNMNLADVVFSTAHKSKGLEFETVKLTDDYSIYDEARFLERGRAGFHQNFHRGPHVFDVEEANILYVAVTRAKCSLIFTSTLAKIMKDAKEYFVYPTMEKSELSEGVCSVCNMHNLYPPLHLLSHNVTGTFFKAGMVCTQCSSLTLPFLHTTPYKKTHK